jgi:hypothetical protein
MYHLTCAARSIYYEGVCLGKKQHMTEAEVITCAFQPVMDWLSKEVGGLLAGREYREKRTNAGTRVDGLIAAIAEDEDGEEVTETVALEAKSLGTFRQLVRKYRAGKGLVEAGAVGIGAAALVSGPVGWLAGLATLLFRADAHRRCDASMQAAGYPGDFRVLVLPSEVFDHYPDLRQPLLDEADSHGFGLAVVTRRSFSWLVEPERCDCDGFGREWLDEYVTADLIYEELVEDAMFERDFEG